MFFRLLGIQKFLYEHFPGISNKRKRKEVSHMLKDSLLKTGTNVMKLGVALLVSTIASQAVREMTNETLNNIIKDFKSIRREYQERRQAA